MKDKNKKIQLQFRLIEIKKLSYFENNLEDLDFKKKIDINKLPFQLGVLLSINDKAGIIEIILKVTYYFNYNYKKYDLLGLNTSHKFEIKDFINTFHKNDKDEYFIPDQIMANLLGMSISGTRGMLAVLNTSQQYNKIIFPLINPIDVLKSGKNQKK